MKKGSTSDLVEDINKKYDPETIKKTLIKFQQLQELGWEIIIDPVENEFYSIKSDDETKIVYRPYVYAPDRHGEDYILNLDTSFDSYYSYLQCLVDTVKAVSKLDNHYNCPYCSMINGEGKKIEIDKDSYMRYKTDGDLIRLIVYRDDTIEPEEVQDIDSDYCMFCGRKLP